MAIIIGCHRWFSSVVLIALAHRAIGLYLGGWACCWRPSLLAIRASEALANSRATSVATRCCGCYNALLCNRRCSRRHSSWLLLRPHQLSREQLFYLSSSCVPLSSSLPTRTCGCRPSRLQPLLQSPPQLSVVAVFLLTSDAVVAVLTVVAVWLSPPLA